jgi:hypothetical protein
MTIERLIPGEIVEMRDPVMGGLKLGLVDSTGIGYFDLHQENELPKPIHSEVQPRGLGPIESWMGGLDAAFAEHLSKTWIYLTSRNLDVLTIARALHAGIDQQIYEPELLEQAGIEATARIKEGRAAVQDALTRE